MLALNFVIASLSAFLFRESSVRVLELHESRDTIPSKYHMVERAPSDQKLTLRIALAQNDPDKLIETLYDVSKPSSDHYGQHLSREQVRVWWDASYASFAEFER